ncbi:MAG: hypothetical protein N2662_05675 [Bacteroidales bacterium]|nr:hypothetical protein [Bacteroidales bacterium]
MRIIFFSRWFIRFKKHEESDEVIVLGNGPSLSVNLERDIDILKQKPVLCVNGFALSDAFEQLKPSYYVLADAAFWSENLRTKTQNFVDNTLEALAKKTNWNMTLFIPVEGYKVFKKKRQNLLSHPFISIQVYNSTVVKGFSGLVHLLLKYNLGILSRQNVLIPSLILAINLGFKRIILLGADHSWHRNLFLTDENVLCLKDDHFYDESSPPIPVMLGNRPSRIHEQFESIAKALRTYWEIAHYARSQMVDIYNASEISYVDAFQRKRLPELF